MFTEICVCVIIFLVIYFFISKTHEKVIDDRIYIRAYDGRNYLVRKTKNAQETADTLADVNKKVIDFIDRLYSESDIEFMPVVTRLKRRYNPNALSEGRIDKNYTSYTINKGEKVVLCVRTRDQDDKLYNMEILTYVLLHELAHIASVSEQHNGEFKTNFTYILKKAIDWKLFTPIKEKFNYCGLNLSGT